MLCSLRQLLVCASECCETVYQTQVWTVTMWVVVPTKLRDRLLSYDFDDREAMSFAIAKYEL